jgi:hypothetical protein
VKAEIDVAQNFDRAKALCDPAKFDDKRHRTLYPLLLITAGGSGAPDRSGFKSTMARELQPRGCIPHLIGRQLEIVVLVVRFGELKRLTRDDLSGTVHFVRTRPLAFRDRKRFSDLAPELALDHVLRRIICHVP